MVLLITMLYLMLLLKPILQFVFSSLAVLIAILCLHLDVNLFNNGLSEISVTEIVQESLLAAIVGVHLWLARRSGAMRACNILIAGFFMSMLLRELDALFDMISHGSWVWFALGVAAVAVTSVARHPARAVQQLVEYTRTPCWGIMLSGLLAVLVFSRLFGMGILWHNLLQDGYLRIVKNMVEEGTELFGYILCATATLVHLVDSNARQKKAH